MALKRATGRLAVRPMARPGRPAASARPATPTPTRFGRPVPSARPATPARPAAPARPTTTARPTARKIVRPLGRSMGPDGSDLVNPAEMRLLQRDLETARQIQGRLMSQKPPEIGGYDFGIHYSPGAKAGGNFYDFFLFDADHLGVVVAEVLGRGLTGSLLMVEARAVVRSMASISSSPREILKGANKVLLRDIQNGMFIAVFFGLLEMSSGKLTIASAGQMPMLIWKQRVKRCFVASPSGLVLGSATEETFDAAIKEDSMSLGPGDRFVLYTPGVTNLQDADGNEFGRTRLVRCTFNNAHLASGQYLTAIKSELDLHRDGMPQSDHLTIVTARRQAESAFDVDWSEQETMRRTRE